MAIPASTIQEMIEKSIPDAQITIEALANDNDHYALYITSASFVGKTRVMQHKMVYDALGGKMGNELHALSIHTKTP